MSLPQPSAGGAPCLRRGALAVTAIAFSLVSLSACGAGTTASTLQVKPDNAATAVGDVKIQNVNVISQPRGSEGPAVVTGKIFNNGAKAQILESITVEGAASKVKLSPPKGSGPLTVPAGGTLILGGAGNASAVLARSGESFRDGDVQPVVFDLSETGEVRLTAFVVPAQDFFKDFGPSTLPTPSAPAKPGGSPSGSATPGGSPSPTPADEEAENGEEAESEDGPNGDTAGASESAAGHTAGH
ncbi:DUF461 domain-containing protein [Streptomyces sp. NPDC004647]|uniref:DUF461 domain-containing protein n=1 Tax=Streptomyces sp. NPDC004647 TaxID=3154671 RepID=UPI0033A83721